MTEPTEIQRYQLLKSKIERVVREMGLNMEHCSILLETEDPKLALVFSVQPEAFETVQEKTQSDTDALFSDIVNNMDGEPEPEVSIKDEVKKQIEDFLKGME